MAEVAASSQPRSPAYRADIDGLRGVAVLLVVLWHAQIPGVRGGYAGVDAFFVISGYVITGTLQRDARAGGISILRFYERRLRRIAPAFLAMLAAVLAAGFVIEFPAELKRTASVALGSLVLSANLVLWREGGYWGPGAGAEPLRHVWSLSIEEQFYLVYPALLALLLARAPKAAVAVLGAVAVLSLGLFLLLFRSSPEAAFELGPARAWELMLGCLCALRGRAWRLPRALAEALTLLGAALLGAAGAGLAADQSWTIVLSTLGAGLLVLGGQRRTLVSRALATRPLVFVGLASYSLYLWHWPLLALANSLQPTGIGPLETGLLLAATAVLGVASWRFIEQPLRRPWPDGRSRRRFFAICGTLGLFAVAASGLALLTGGAPARFPPPVAAIAAFEGYHGTPAWRAQFHPECFAERPQPSDYDAARCFTAAPGRRNVLLWGDSHAAELAGPLTGLAARLGAHLMQATMANCAPTLRAERGCQRFNDLVRARLEAQRVDVVILAFSATTPASGFAEQLDALTRGGAKVIVFGPTPQYETWAAPALARAWPQPPDLARWIIPKPFDVDAALKATTAGRAGVAYVSAIDLLCRARRCALLTATGAPVIWDANHLTPEAAQALVEHAARPLAEDLGAPARPSPGP